MKKITLILLLGVGIVSINGCKKKEKDENSDAPRVNAIVENAFEEIGNIGNQAVSGDLVFYKNDGTVYTSYEGGRDLSVDKAACNVIITIDTTSNPKSVTVDYGNVNCDCNDGKQRRGKVITTFTGSYYATGTVITHTTEDYYVNDHHVEGTMTVTNMGPNADGKPYYNVQITGVVTLSTGEIVTYTSTRVRTFVNGSNTQWFFWDDEYDVTGTATAEVVNGDGYFAETTEPLNVKVGCGYIRKGKLSFTPTGYPTYYIDYGTGTCDATLTVTVNGVTYTIN